MGILCVPNIPSSLLYKDLARIVNLGNSHLFRSGPFDADFVEENPICCFHPPDSADFIRKPVLYKRV